MNDAEQLDRNIRQAVVEESNRLPPILRVRMDMAYGKLPNWKSLRRNRLALQTAIIVVAMMLSIWSLGFISPAMANYLSNLPIVGSAFQSAGDVGLKHAGEIGGSTSSRLTVTDKGVSLTIDQVVYDGSRLSIGFLHDSKVRSFDIRADQIQVNGARILSGYGLRTSEVSPGITATVLTSTVDQALPDQFTLALQINHVQRWENEVKTDLKGKWSFKVNVVKLLDGVFEKSFNPHLSAEWEGIEISLTEAAATPLTTRISFDLIKPDYLDPNHIFTETRTEGETTLRRELRFRLFDNQGEEISFLSGHASSSGNDVEHLIELFAPLSEFQRDELILRTYVITTPVKKVNSTDYVSAGQPEERHLPELDIVIPKLTRG